MSTSVPSPPAPSLSSDQLTPDELQRVVEHLPYFAVIVDSERRFAWCNRLDPTLTKEQVLGQRIETFAPSEYHAVAIEIVDRCLNEGQEGYYETRGYDEGEYETWYGCRVVPLPPDAAGKPRALVLSHDITDRKRTATALAESEGRFRQLVETSPDTIATLDQRRRFVYINHPVSSAEVDLDDVRGRDAAEFVAPEDRERVAHVLDDALRTRHPITYECTGALTGSRFRIRFVPLPSDTSGPGAESGLMVATDVSEERAAEARLITMMKELDHRVKNTLATILAMTRQTLERADSLPEFRESFVGRLEAMARAHDALAAAQWTAVAVQRLASDALTPYVSDLDAVLERVPKLLLPATVVAPLAMVLHELVTNAVKHGGLSKAQQSLRISMDVEADDRLTIDWRENAPQKLDQVSARGFGMTLVRGVVERQLAGTFEMDIEETARRYRLQIPLHKKQKR